MIQRSSARFRVIILVLTAAAIVFAFVHSAMSSNISSQESRWAYVFLNGILKAFGAGYQLSEHFVRKLAHFSEYTAIGMLLTSCAYSFDRFKPYRYLAYVFFAGLGTAFVDETIQLFSEGRAGMITDMWIDFSGVVLGTAIMLLFYFVYQRIRRKKMKHE
ncbi:MAG: VanZ family protein [Ruminococcus sp.]|nr:VanZ family protein [Ruminococcus sp.]